LKDLNDPTWWDPYHTFCETVPTFLNELFIPSNKEDSSSTTLVSFPFLEEGYLANSKTSLFSPESTFGEIDLSHPPSRNAMARLFSDGWFSTLDAQFALPRHRVFKHFLFIKQIYTIFKDKLQPLSEMERDQDSDSIFLHIAKDQDSASTLCQDLYHLAWDLYRIGEALSEQNNTLPIGCHSYPSKPSLSLATYQSMPKTEEERKELEENLKTTLALKLRYPNSIANLLYAKTKEVLELTMKLSQIIEKELISVFFPEASLSRPLTESDLYQKLSHWLAQEKSFLTI
jgi:hypothetical protein